MNKPISAVIIFLAILSLISCGVPSTETNGNLSGGGSLKLYVSGGKSFNANIEHGRIVKYQVEITGENIEEPIIAHFDGSATSGQIDGIPVGNDRLVTVKALNPNEMIIRQGEAENVIIKGGQTANVEMTLESVPIFTNLADGNIIDNTRLIFKTFADPTNPVLIEEAVQGNYLTLVDADSLSAEVNLDQNTGLGQVAPEIQPVGQHTYTIRDSVTDRNSTITITLTDGTKRRPANLFATGDSLYPDEQGRMSWQ